MAITQKDLDSLVKQLNQAKKYTPVRSVGRYKNGAYKSSKGFHLDYAYGGVKLVFSKKDSSAESSITKGYGTKKELYEKMTGMLTGINL